MPLFDEITNRTRHFCRLQRIVVGDGVAILLDDRSEIGDAALPR